jgi:Phosphodiester glycosidase/FlgD Ig-like domain
MLPRTAILLLLMVAFAAPARGQAVELVPGVTYQRMLQFTPHGVVVVHVLTAPRPAAGGLYQLAPVLAGGAVSGGTERVTKLERDVSAAATVAGVAGDLFSRTDGHPSGIVMQGGVLAHAPLAGRSSIGVDAGGALQVARLRFFGTWQGTGQRRSLAGVNQLPLPGQTVLFTPAWGTKAPTAAGASEVVLTAFPSAAPNVDLVGRVVASGAGGGEAIPVGGAVLLARGVAAPKLRAEAAVGTIVHSRLILQPSWDGVATAFGGGPALVRGGRAVFRPSEDFTSAQLTGRSPRAAVGQLPDGRILLVAVDGDRPGYSAGLTSFELAQALVRLGTVTAAGLAPGDAVTAAFDGTLLNRPSGRGELPVKEALLVEYFGVYAPDPPLALVTGDPGRAQETLSYKLVRPSTVTSELVGADGAQHVVESGVQRQPGTYSFTYTTFDREGTWHWNVAATDDLGRTSSADRTFRYDATLRDLVAPRAARGTVAFRFTLSRPAQVTLQVETQTGVVLRALAPVSLPPGPATVTWDGSLPQGSPAFAGTYLAHVTVTSEVGTSDLSVPFSYHR